ncbi:MAG: hypothetical protein HY289_04250 [Planctomycetes bacterium]|nr:hypothetical protein [Planctomycetota bacterium]
MITVDCPHCSRSLQLPDDLAGITVRCANCQQTFAMPSRSAVARGEPRPRSAETGMTAKAPVPSSDDADDPMPLERRDIARKPSARLLLIVVVSALVLGLCVCAVPAAFFLLPVAFWAGHEKIQVAQAEPPQDALKEEKKPGKRPLEEIVPIELIDIEIIDAKRFERLGDKRLDAGGHKRLYLLHRQEPRSIEELEPFFKAHGRASKDADEKYEIRAIVTGANGNDLELVNGPVDLLRNRAKKHHINVSLREED